MCVYIFVLGQVHS